MAKKPQTTEEPIVQEDTALERLVELATNAEFSSGSLVADIRDAILDQYKNRTKPWSALSQDEQRDLGRTIEHVAKTVVRKAVLVIAEQDEISVTGTLKGYSGKGGQFSLKVEAEGDEDTALQLFKMDGHAVVLMSADSKRFETNRPAETEPDQHALGFEGDDEAKQPPADDSDLVEAASANGEGGPPVDA